MPELIEVVTAHTQDLGKIGTTRAYIDDYVKRHPQETSLPTICRNVGDLLLGVHLTDVATECFKLAFLQSFQDTDPYDYAWALHAGRFIEGLHEAKLQYESDPEIPGWFPTNQHPLRQAISCLSHHANNAIFEEGYFNSARTEEGGIIWENEERKNRYEYSENRRVRGQELLDLMLQAPNEAPVSDPSA